MSSLRTAALALATALTAAGAAWAGSAEETIDRTLTLAKGQQVVVQNLNGSVEVSAWDSPQVRLVAIKTARAATDGRAKAYLKELKVEVERKGGQLLIKTRTPGAEGGLRGWIACTGASGEVAYRLQLPREARLVVTTVNGDVQVAGLQGRVRATSTNGNVELGVDGEVDASSVNGSIRAGMRRSEPRSAMELSTVNGNIVLLLPAEFRAYVDARTTNGSVGSDLPLQVDGRRSRSRLIGRLNGGNTRLTLRSSNGSIYLRTPSQ